MNISRLLCTTLLLMGVCLTSVVARAADCTVMVKAEKAARDGTPVFVELESSQNVNAASVVTAQGRQPAQVTPLGDGKVRVCWLVNNLNAEQTREYAIHLGKATAPEAGFVWKDSSEGAAKSKDLLFIERPVLRYMHTPFDPENIELTKKPFHHVLAPDGSQLITKGPGGLYPHHRGIYFGYNRCKVGTSTVDIWHAKSGEHTVHTAFVREDAGPVFGGHTVKINWKDRKGESFASEERSLQTYRQAKGQVLIDFSTRLVAVAGPVSLGGDRQHAGVQFRASQDVADSRKETRYLRPGKWAELPADKEVNNAQHVDLPWNALQCTVDGKRYTVVYMSHPSNPDGAEFSERTYGRFGEFFPWKLDKENPLQVQYRIWILEGDDVTRESIESKYSDWVHPPQISKL